MGYTVIMKPKIISLEQSLLLELFEFKDNNLIWKKRPDKLKRLIGKIAGCLHRSGYRTIKINNIEYPAHRLIWIYHYGSIDNDLVIDHIDGNKSNNDINNLRLVTQQQNCFNRSKLTSKGYSWNKNTNKWQSHIFVDGVQKYLGSFLNEKDARDAYSNALNRYFLI